MSKQIFRERPPEAVQPERLDDMLRLVKPGSWLILGTLAVLSAAAVAWGCIGRLPVTSSSNALLVYPRKVVSLYAPGSGRLLSLDAYVGQRFEKDQVLGTVRLPDTERDLTQKRIELESFLARKRTTNDMEAANAKRETAYLDEQISRTNKRIELLKARAEVLDKKNTAIDAEKRKKLERTIKVTQDLAKTLKKKHETFVDLRKDGLTNDEQVFNARRAMVDNELRLAELDIQKQELELRELQTEEARTKRQDEIADLALRVQDNEYKKTQLEQRLVKDSLEEKTQEDQIRREIARLEYVLETKGKITADRPGRIVEIAAAVGELVNQGGRIGSIEIEDPSSSLMVLAYFTIVDGKKIQKGMRARVSPDTVAKQKFGAIRAKVESVSDYPVTREAVGNQIGNTEMAQDLTQGGRSIEVLLSLEADSESFSGYAWSTGRGPEMKITAGTTSTARVTLKEVAPITLIVPSLAPWFEDAQ